MNIHMFTYIIFNTLIQILTIKKAPITRGFFVQTNDKYQKLF